MYSAYKLNKQDDNIQTCRTPFPIWNQSVVSCPVLTVASWLAYRFLRRQVRWSGIPISWGISQFVVIHTDKGFGIIHKAEVYVFLELSCSFDDLMDVTNLISASAAFSKSSLNIWNFTVHILLKPGLENFQHVRWVQLCSSLDILWQCLSLRLEWTVLFQSCGHCWVFQICWHIECSTFTASSFRIWNSSTGILSPPLALFAVKLPKAHLTSHSRRSGSRWVIIPSWLFGSWRSFLYSSYAYCCHLFLISSASLRFILFLSFIVPTFAWNVPFISLIFLKRCLIFSILLFSSISLHRSLRKAFLSLLAILWNSAFIFPFLLCFSLLFFSQLFVRPPQTAILLFCISFPWGWPWSLSPVQCHEPPSIVLQALSLSDLISWIYFSLLLYNRKGFDLGHAWMV